MRTLTGLVVTVVLVLALFHSADSWPIWATLILTIATVITATVTVMLVSDNPRGRHFWQVVFGGVDDDE